MNTLFTLLLLKIQNICIKLLTKLNGSRMMTLTSQYLGWTVLFNRDKTGWKFEATRLNCHETLTSGIFYPNADLAYLEAKHLIEAYQSQERLGNWLEELKQKQEISSEGFNQGLELISQIVAKPSQPEL